MAIALMAMISCMQEMSLALLTPNLHHLLCALTDQALAVGDTRSFLELWVERTMKFAKRKSKFRATSDPEKVLCNELELWRSHKLLKNCPNRVLELNELLPPYGKRTMVQYTNPDNEATSAEGSFLLGSGQPFNDDAHGLDIHSLLSLARDEIIGPNPEICQGWNEEMLDEATVRVYVHMRAMFRDREVLTGRMYGLERARDSSHVSVEYEDAEGIKKMHIASIQYFVRIEKINGDIPPLRFAMAHFYDYMPPLNDHDLGLIHKVDVTRFEERNYGRWQPVLFPSVQGKLIHCTVGNQRYLVGYNISTGMY